MQGRVKAYNEDRAFGFIVGEDGQDYFFHLSNWKSVAPILRGCVVLFAPEETEKGKVAKEVCPCDTTNKKPEFIVLGSERIKLSNVKTYGIASGKAYFVKVYEHKPEAKIGLFGSAKFVDRLVWSKNDIQISENDTHVEYLFKGSMQYNGVSVFNPKTKNNQRLTTKLVRDSHGNISFDSDIPFNKSEDVYTEMQDYLYVTTYQNNNYQWFKGLASFDIYEKCKELDQYVNV